MNFVQPVFLAFLATILAVHALLGRLPRGAHRARNLALLLASWVFYGWVHPWFLGLLLLSALTDWAAALAIELRPRWRDLALAGSVILNLSLLAWFKYLDFFLVSVADALRALGLGTSLGALGVALPVGISFYTFQTMSYTVDVYRGSVRARRDLVDYLLYVSFFPQLVAGPIERADRLLAQVERPRSVTVEGALSGVTLALWGGFQKIVVADTLAPYVDKVFVLSAPAGPLVWAAALAFSLQIYADFAGYTDLARGTARLFGFELTENFRSPYLATSTPDFWQRWHISLSTWIRDYLFVPLLGTSARIGGARFVGATLLTFALIGLWHGAAWHFVLFGLWHGCWMVAYTLASSAWGARPLPPAWVAVPFHFLAVSVPGSLLFRETRLDRLAHDLSVSPFTATEDEWTAAAVVVGFTALGALPMTAAYAAKRWIWPWAEGAGWGLPLRTTLWAALALGMFTFQRVSAYDFVYFQF